MGNRHSWFLASTLVAGCVLWGPEPARAGSIRSPSDSIYPTPPPHTEKCDAIKRRYADLAGQLVG